MSHRDCAEQKKPGRALPGGLFLGCGKENFLVLGLLLGRFLFGGLCFLDFAGNEHSVFLFAFDDAGDSDGHLAVGRANVVVERFGGFVVFQEDDALDWFSLLVFALDGQCRLTGFCLLQRAFGASQHASNSALFFLRFLFLRDNGGDCQTQGNDD